MNRFVAPLLALATLAGSGCTELLDALLNSQNPHSLTATHGEGSSIRLSWVAPAQDGEEIEVDFYEVHCEGRGTIGSTSGTSFTDHGAQMATKYEYWVSANFADGGVSGASNSATGWYIDAEKLSWVSRGTPEATDAPDGWFKTLVVEGWQYEVTRVGGGGGSYQISAWDDFEDPVGTITIATRWRAPATGKVWIQVPPGTVLRARHY